MIVRYSHERGFRAGPVPGKMGSQTGTTQGTKLRNLIARRQCSDNGTMSRCGIGPSFGLCYGFR
jgi:hypothetical protein